VYGAAGQVGTGESLGDVCTVASKVEYREDTTFSCRMEEHQLCGSSTHRSMFADATACECACHRVADSLVKALRDPDGLPEGPDVVGA